MRYATEPEWVLDASAVLAFVHAETGADVVQGTLREALISSVNWTEVMQRALSRGVDKGTLRQRLLGAGLVVAPFTIDQAEGAADLWSETRRFGLSLGDRACLALGMTSNLPVLTADRAWLNLSLPIEVRMIR